jgi:hypothetical protein
VLNVPYELQLVTNLHFAATQTKTRLSQCQIAGDLETKHLHNLVLTNRFLYRLLENKLYKALLKDALTPVIDTENVAGLKRFLGCGLDVKIILRRSAFKKPVPFLAYVVSERNPTFMAMVKLLFATEKIEIVGWGVSALTVDHKWSGAAKDMVELWVKHGVPVFPLVGFEQRVAQKGQMVWLSWGWLH